MYIVDVAVPLSQAVLARPYSDKVGIIDMPFNSQNTIMNCDHIYCYPQNICEKCQVFIMSAYISWVFCVLQLRVDQVFRGTDPPTTVKQHLNISFRKQICTRLLSLHNGEIMCLQLICICTPH